MSGSPIVFVHGLGGDPSATWGNFPRLIADDASLRDRPVLSFGFPTFLFRLPFASRAPGVQTLADGLRTFINLRCGDTWDVSLVCHSLGGIIARRYLVDEVKRGTRPRVSNLLLYAVPMNGAHLAHVATQISWRHNQLRQLCKDSDVLRDLEADWEILEVSKQLRTRYVLGGQDRVVTESSARHAWGNTDVDVIPGRGHIDIVKPKDADDDAFLILRSFLGGLKSDPQPAAHKSRSAAPFKQRPIEAIEPSELTLLEVLSETTHSLIQKCEHDGRIVVLKRTKADLCDVEAIRTVMAAKSKNTDLSVYARSAMHVPEAVWSRGGFVWEIQDWIDGASLGDLVAKNRGGFGAAFQNGCAGSLFELLLGLRELKVVHRDINPDNIMFGGDGQFRVIDWTFCVREGTPQTPVNTAGFTPPEQERGQASHASDWYAAGATLFFLATGKAPDQRNALTYQEGLAAIQDVRRGFRYVRSNRGSMGEGLRQLVAEVLEREVTKRTLPEYFDEDRITAETYLEILDPVAARILSVGDRADLVILGARYYALPGDLDIFMSILGMLKRGLNNPALTAEEARTRRESLEALDDLAIKYGES